MKIQIIILLIIIIFCMSCDKIFKKDENENPVITIQFNKETVAVGSENLLRATASDPDDDDSVTISWTVTAGMLSSTIGDSIVWTAPPDTQSVEIRAEARDTNDGGTTAKLTVFVGNDNPVISDFSGTAERVLPGNQITFSCSATDPEAQALTYAFSTEPAGGLMTHDDPAAATATWTAPSDLNPSGYFPASWYKIKVAVSDPQNYVAYDSINVLVYSEFGSVWIVDSEKRTLEKRTNNGELVLTSPHPFQKPVAAANNIDESYGCFVADYNAGEIVKLDADGEVINQFSGIATAVDVAVHRDTRTIWALSIGDNSLTVINGYTNQQIKKIYGFNQPEKLHINQSSGDVWIIESGNNRIVKLTASDSPVSLPDTINAQNAAIYPAPGSPAIFNNPTQISLRNISGSRVFISDKNDHQVEVFDYLNNTYVRQEPPINLLPLAPIFLQPISITNLGWHVFAMNSDASIVVFPENNYQNILPLTGNYNFQNPRALEIDQRSGAIWIGDNGTNQLIKLEVNPDYSFSVLDKISGYMFIEDIVINN